MSRTKIALVFAAILCVSYLGCPPTTMVTVPNVGGMTEDDAMDTILDAQLAVAPVPQASDTVAAGHVISQNPAAGTSVRQETTINIYVSIGALPSVAWTYNSNNNAIIGNSIDHTSDGGFIIAGGNSAYNMFALKLNAGGGKAWDQTYSNMSTVGTPSELWRCEATGIRETVDGYVMLGAGHNQGDLLPDKSFLLVKVNSQGVVQSSQAYAPVNPYSLTSQLCVNNYGRALQVTSDGGFLAVGDSYVGQYDLASILKTDADGDVEILQVIDDDGKDYDEHIQAGLQTSDGDYVLAGYSSNGSPAGYLALLIKVSSTGVSQWRQAYQFPSQDHGAMAYCVTETANGHFLIAGELINYINNNKSINFGPWIARVDANGDEIWSRSYASITSVRSPKAIVETPQGDFLAAGSLNGHLMLSKFDAAGDLLWNYEVTAAPGTGQAMVLTDDGGCVILASGGSGGAKVLKINHVYIP